MGDTKPGDVGEYVGLVGVKAGDEGEPPHAGLTEYGLCGFIIGEVGE